MDRQHPLWDLTLVQGLKGNRTGLIFRMHHCLADGIAGVGMMSVLMDASPRRRHLPRKKAACPTVPPRRDATAAGLEGLAESYSDFVNRILSAWSGALNMAEAGSRESGRNLAGDELPGCCRNSRRHRALAV